jgi:hypothetical protein
VSSFFRHQRTQDYLVRLQIDAMLSDDGHLKTPAVPTSLRIEINP